MRMFTPDRIKSLVGLEHNVYNYIIKNPDKIKKMTIRELSEEIHVSTTIILRFCKKMNCSGFSEFKVKYKMSFDKKEAFLEKENLGLVFEYMKSVNDEQVIPQVKKAAVLIYKARQVIFLGQGSSGIIAKYGARHLTDLGKLVYYFTDPHNPIPSGNHEETVIVVLSVSGETNFIIRQINRFKELKAVIISITSNSNNKVQKLSDISFNYNLPIEDIPPQQLPRINITSQVAPVYLIETIGKAMYKIITKETMEK